ncbi:MAG: response regulator [Deltaproteobacteria bacterium]|nr:response regulator [Deltaproteobacteria bacterium]
MRALVVDDELSTRILLQGLARANGLEVVCASDGDEAWELHRRSPFPLVLTDWMMPTMSGIELTQRIRAGSSAELYTYVLVVTTLSAREHTLRAFEAGADDMLCKPVDADQLAARIGVARRFLTAHGRRAEEAYSASLETLQTELGHQHTSLTDNLSALVRLYRGRGAVARARAFLRREIDLVVATAGEGDSRVAALRAELASMV